MPLPRRPAMDIAPPLQQCPLPDIRTPCVPNPFTRMRRPPESRLLTSASAFFDAALRAMSTRGLSIPLFDRRKQTRSSRRLQKVFTIASRRKRNHSLNSPQSSFKRPMRRTWGMRPRSSTSKYAGPSPRVLCTIQVSSGSPPYLPSQGKKI
eukprot:COSAG01_NODE_5744_length_4062_cov_8.080242_5_plen_151_part_00